MTSTLPPPASAPTATPTRDEIRAAVHMLMRAWASQHLLEGPPRPLPYDYDPDDETNGCACGGAGEDGDDEPTCNCAGGCVCRACMHSEHAQTRRCRRITPEEGRPYAWCNQATKYVITPWCVHRDGVLREPSPGDEAERTGAGNVALGDSRQEHAKMYACSTHHARDLITADRARRGTGDSKLSADNTYYEIDSFRYQPDEVDVPGPLHALLRNYEMGAYSAREAIAATAGYRTHRSLAHDVDGFLLSAAWAGRHALEYLEYRDRELDDE